MLTFIYFILILGIIVLVHEFGHLYSLRYLEFRYMNFQLEWDLDYLVLKRLKERHNIM